MAKPPETKVCAHPTCNLVATLVPLSPLSRLIHLSNRFGPIKLKRQYDCPEHGKLDER